MSGIHNDLKILCINKSKRSEYVVIKTIKKSQQYED